MITRSIQCLSTECQSSIDLRHSCIYLIENVAARFHNRCGAPSLWWVSLNYSQPELTSKIYIYINVYGPQRICCVQMMEGSNTVGMGISHTKLSVIAIHNFALPSLAAFDGSATKRESIGLCIYVWLCLFIL